MNTPSEVTAEIGNTRRKSVGSGGGKTRRYSIGVTSSQKSVGEEGNIVPNYLRASTGSCHDFCKYGKKHEQSTKSTVPIKFKRTTVFDNKLSKTVVPLDVKSKKDMAVPKPEIQNPVNVTKKDVLLASKTPQVHKPSSLTNGKTVKNEVKAFQQSTSVVKSSPVVVNGEGCNDETKKKDVKTVKKTMVTVKKVVTKESQSPKASFSRAASLKPIISKCVKKVSPLEEKNRRLKTEPKQTVADTVQTKTLHGVEAESEVKTDTIEFDFIQPSVELVNPPVCNNTDSFSDKSVVEEESTVIHPVYESSQVSSDKDVLDEEAVIAPRDSETSESFYDDEALENEFDYTDDEESEFSEEGSERTEITNVNEREISDANTKIPRKGKMVISEGKDVEAVKLRFRRGKVVDLQCESNGPRRLKFRRRVIEGNEIEDDQNTSRNVKFVKGKVMEGDEEKKRVFRRSFEKKYVEGINESNNGKESVVLKHQGEQEKKDGQGLLNNVIEEAASKLVESRKSKVKALVGAFETVISRQEGKPSLT